MSLFSVVSDNARSESKALEGCRVSSKSPSRVRDGDEGVAGRNGREKCFTDEGSLICPPDKSKIFFTKWKQKKTVRSCTLVAPLTTRPLCRRVCTAAVAATVEKQQAPSNFKMSLAKAKNALSYPSKEVASNDKLWLTTLQSVRNARLSQQRFWHCHENRITKTIPHNLYVSFKSAPLYC